MKVLGVVLDRVWRSTSTSRRWHDRATTMHRPSDIFGTCWLRNSHRRWLAVWSCQGSTTATLCSTALQTTESRCCNGCRTTRLGSYSKCLDDPTPRHYSGSCTGCPFSSGTLQSGPADVQGLQHVDAVVPSTPDQGAGTRPQPTIRHHVAVSTIVIVKCAFRCTAPAIWNSLPKRVIDSDFITVFLARDVIYTSRAYATMSVSVCLSVSLWRLCMLG